VIAPEDAGVSANLAFGAFSPTVWKSGAEYNMLLVGRKFVVAFGGLPRCNFCRRQSLWELVAVHGSRVIVRLVETFAFRLSILEPISAGNERCVYTQKG